MGKQHPVTMEEKYVLGNDGTPFYTREYFPTAGVPDAFILFHHGFAEHIGRYDAFFRLLAGAPHNLHVTAFDSRGHGRTSQQPLPADAPEVKQWREEGRTVVPEKGQKHRTGGWGRQIPDYEFMVKREAARAHAVGRKLFLYGHSMVRAPAGKLTAGRRAHARLLHARGARARARARDAQASRRRHCVGAVYPADQAEQLYPDQGGHAGRVDRARQHCHSHPPRRQGLYARP
jgi:pimeloyl-ACP methyl ester carboxylesterase